MERGGRKNGTQAVFVLYHTKHYLIPDKPTHLMYQFQMDPCDNTDAIDDNLNAVEAWSRGGAKTIVQGDPLDVEVRLFELPDIADLEDFDNLQVDDDTLPDSDVKSSELESNDSVIDSIRNLDTPSTESMSDVDNDPLAADEGDDGPGTRDDTTYVEDIELSSAASEAEDNGADYSKSPNDKRLQKKGKKRGYPECCRGIAWLINTTSCRRAVSRLILDDVAFDPAEYTLRTVSTPNHLECCNKNCPPGSATLSAAIAALLPPGFDTYTTTDEIDEEATTRDWSDF